jgi:hypothetical protein
VLTNADLKKTIWERTRATVARWLPCRLSWAEISEDPTSRSVGWRFGLRLHLLRGVSFVSACKRGAPRLAQRAVGLRLCQVDTAREAVAALTLRRRCQWSRLARGCTSRAAPAATHSSLWRPSFQVVLRKDCLPLPQVQPTSYSFTENERC